MTEEEFNDLQRVCNTERQHEILQMVHDHGGVRPAARATGTNRETIREIITRLKERAALYGHGADHLPHVNGALPGFSTKRISSYTAPDGSVSGWHIQCPEEKAKEEAFAAFAEGLAGTLKRVKAKPLPKGVYE